MFKILKVTGDSLSPDYHAGDYVVVSKFLRSPRSGDVIAFWNETYGTMMKKVQQVTANGMEFFVVGTHPHSVDSRHFGIIRKEDVIGSVLWHIPKVT